MSAISMPRKLWEHQSPESTQMGRFRRALETSVGQRFDSFHDMYQFSVNNRAAFWGFSWEYFRIIHEGAYEQVVDELARIDSIPSWFPGVKLNFAENVLFSYANGDTTDKEDTRIAVTELSEDSSDVPVHLCWGELRQKTGALIQAMKAHGVVKGDRIAACSGNNINTMLVFLASTALGAIFSSSSTDMGVEGILDRLLQIKPSWLFMDDWAVYNGKTIDLRPKMQDIIHGLESVDEFRGVISQPRLALDPGDICHISKCYTLSNFLAQGSGDALEFEHVAFGDPLLIVYSSGTTGQPKCIVHSVGGVLMNTHKEAGLHTEIGPNSVNLQYTTTGWIMYLLSIQNLVLGSRVLLYDGSPFKPDMTTLIRVSARERVTHLGISPRWLYEYQRANMSPMKMADLSSLQVVTSTGMVLPDSLFEWFYDEGFPATVRLNNISGGTDIAGCFGISNALVPVHTGGCAGFSLGIDVQVYDSTIEGGEGVKGTPIEDGVPGELVATSAFPNMPSYFWGDSGGQKYRQAYFSRFDNVWTHGDFVSIHPTTKQLMFHGRADGVLNPSGVRFGSAEIYRVIEDKFRLEVADCVCVGQRRPQDPDERVMLFLKMNQGYHFTDDLVQRVKRQIRSEISARHVPAFVFQTFEIPTTVNLKKVELPIKHIVSGRRIKPSGTLLNPKSLEYYYQFAEVEKLQRESKL